MKSLKQTFFLANVNLANYGGLLQFWVFSPKKRELVKSGFGEMMSIKKLTFFFFFNIRTPLRLRFSRNLELFVQIETISLKTVLFDVSDSRQKGQLFR